MCLAPAIQAALPGTPPGRIAGSAHKVLGFYGCGAKLPEK